MDLTSGKKIYCFITLQESLSYIYPARYTNWFYKITTVQLDISTEFRNIHLVQKDQAAVICINHQSALDAIRKRKSSKSFAQTLVNPLLAVLLMFAPHAGRISPIAKKELLYLVPLGFCCWLAGIKLIDRSSPEAAYKTLSRCVEDMKRNNIKLIIFPEGTRGHGKGTSGLLPFKRGAFKTAIMGQVPIIPLVVSPYYFIDHGKREFYKGHVILKALEPIPTKGMKDDDHEGLMMKTKGVMLREYEKLAAEVEGFK